MINIKKFSIIIPVYNTEKYIDECLTSLLNQTYSNFEIIIVDDGSNDSSYSICKKYQRKDNRIKLYKQKNSGVSSARNLGITKCNGEYILFVDSDDYLSYNALENIVKYTDNDTLISFGYIKKYRNKEVIYKSVDKLYDNYNDILECIFLNSAINGYLANKVFSAKIIKKNNLKLDTKIHYSEDLQFTLKYLSFGSKLLNVNLPLYYYRMRKSSASYNYITNKNATILDSYKMLLNTYSHNCKIKNKIELIYLYNYWKFKDICNDKFTLEKIVKREKEIINNNKLNYFEKIKYYVIYRNKSIYLISKSIKNIIEKTYI